MKFNSKSNWCNKQIDIRSENVCLKVRFFKKLFFNLFEHKFESKNLYISVIPRLRSIVLKLGLCWLHKHKMRARLTSLIFESIIVLQTIWKWGVFPCAYFALTWSIWISSYSVCIFHVSSMSIQNWIEKETKRKLKKNLFRFGM